METFPHDALDVFPFYLHRLPVKGDRPFHGPFVGFGGEGIKDKSIVRTWCMRGTLHLLAAHDLQWLLSLHGPEFIRKSKRRYEQLGLSEEICIKAVEAIRNILTSESPLTRAELAEKLSKIGIPTEGQAEPIT